MHRQMRSWAGRGSVFGKKVNWGEIAIIRNSGNLGKAREFGEGEGIWVGSRIDTVQGSVARMQNQGTTDDNIKIPIVEAGGVVKKIRGKDRLKFFIRLQIIKNSSTYMLRHFFIGAVLLVAVAACTSRPEFRDGQWRAYLERKDGNRIVFNFEVKDSGGRKVLYVRNAGERLLVDSITLAGDSVLIRMPFFESQLRGALTADGNLEGVWLIHLQDSYRAMPFRAVYGEDYRFKGHSAASGDGDGSGAAGSGAGDGSGSGSGSGLGSSRGQGRGPVWRWFRGGGRRCSVRRMAKTRRSGWGNLSRMGTG